MSKVNSTLPLKKKDTVQQKYVQCTLSHISIYYAHNLTLIISLTDQSSSSISWFLVEAAVVVVG